MASVVTICNMALGRIGIDQTIENIDDANNRSRMCKLFYAETRDQLLRDFDWNFAKAVVAAGLVSDEMSFGWQYTYSYPNDAVVVRALTDSSGLRMPGWYSPTCAFGDYYGLQAQMRRIPFDIRANPDTTGRIIVTDLAEAYVWYTKRIEDPNQFDPLFTSALAWRLAAEIGGPLKASASVVQNAMNMAIAVTGQAATNTMNEQGMQDTRMSPSVAGRN